MTLNAQGELFIIAHACKTESSLAAVRESKQGQFGTDVNKHAIEFSANSSDGIIVNQIIYFMTGLFQQEMKFMLTMK